MQRRRFLTASVLALAAPLAGAKAASLTVGVATTQFRRFSNRQLADELKAQGVRTIQLFLTQTDSNYWKYNSHSDLAGLSAERAAEIAGVYRSAGISIHSIGVYANLIHPDAAERKASLAYFERMMKLGGRMGVRAFVTEAGHHRPSEPEKGPHYHFREDVWRQMLETGKELARLAEANGAAVLLEPYFEGFLCTAARTRKFIEEVGSPRIRVNLDPANLLEVNTVDEMLEQLGALTDCFHAKDRKYHVQKGVPAGEGDLDYGRFVTLAARHRPDSPLILEYVDEKDYKQALAHLRRALRDAGVAERR